jgi:hypothetical protein
VPDVWFAVVPIAVLTADVAVIVAAIMSGVLNRIR